MWPEPDIVYCSVPGFPVTLLLCLKTHLSIKCTPKLHLSDFSLELRKNYNNAFGSLTIKFDHYALTLLLITVKAFLLPAYFGRKYRKLHNPLTYTCNCNNLQRQTGNYQKNHDLLSRCWLEDPSSGLSVFVYVRHFWFIFLRKSVFNSHLLSLSNCHVPLSPWIPDLLLPKSSNRTILPLFPSENYFYTTHAFKISNTCFLTGAWDTSVFSFFLI